MGKPNVLDFKFAFWMKTKGVQGMLLNRDSRLVTYAEVRFIIDLSVAAFQVWNSVPHSGLDRVELLQQEE